jgi:adenylyltransferase/sulfurtransferase
MQTSGEDFQLIDVREPHEFESANLGALLIPLGSISEKSALIDNDNKVVIHCSSGARSAKAIRELEKEFGFENLYNLKGGIIGYLDEIPSKP